MVFPPTPTIPAIHTKHQPIMCKGKSPGRLSSALDERRELLV
jgi:hypothetical protein